MRRITLKHPGTGDVRLIPAGWSWSFFWYAAFLGLPLFMRGLPLWGTVMLTVWCLRFVGPMIAESPGQAMAAETGFTILVTALCFYLGLRGNALSEQHYIACGYERA